MSWSCFVSLCIAVVGSRAALLIQRFKEMQGEQTIYGELVEKKELLWLVISDREL